MAPTRVGIIGLRAIVNDGMAPGTWGLQHLTALRASPYYEVTAVSNTSVESAQKAIDVHKLDARAYGSPEDIARDPNVDMILVSVHVDRHYELMKPALENGKHVYVEFPVAPKPEEVRELAELAKRNNVKVVVGAQAPLDPAFRKLHSVVKGGEIGDIVSSTMQGYFPVVTADGWPQVRSVFLNVESGISRARGVLGHILFAYTRVVGHFKEVQSALKVQYKTAALVDDKGNVVDPAYPTTTPDTIFVQGVLENGGLASVALRSARSAVDSTGFRWIISGTKGEVELVTEPGVIQFLGSGSKIRLRKWGADAEDVNLDAEEDHVSKLPSAAPSVGRLWEAFAKGEEYSDIEESIKIHEVVEKINGEGIWAS